MIMTNYSAINDHASTSCLPAAQQNTFLPT